MSDIKPFISKDWTSEERLKIIVVLTDFIRDDINLGNYGGTQEEPRPNIQSIHEFISATPAKLESYREDFEREISKSIFFTTNPEAWNNWKLPC